MNVSGELGIDLSRVTALQAVARDAEQADAKRCAKLTDGSVTSPGTQTARLLGWLAAVGVVLENTERATIEEALLQEGLSADGAGSDADTLTYGQSIYA